MKNKELHKAFPCRALGGVTACAVTSSFIGCACEQPATSREVTSWDMCDLPSSVRKGCSCCHCAIAGTEFGRFIYCKVQEVDPILLQLPSDRLSAATSVQMGPHSAVQMVPLSRTHRWGKPQTTAAYLGLCLVLWPRWMGPHATHMAGASTAPASPVRFRMGCF